MQKNILHVLTAILALLAGLALLSACGPAAPQVPTPDPKMIITQAAQTVAAQLTANPPASPTPAPTNPPLPTETNSGPVPTIEQPTQPPASGATNTPPTTGQAVSQDNGSFVADITIPDDTGAAPGVQFVKTWRIKNTGKSTWTSAYALVPIDGDHMGSPDSIPMPTQVRPGETVDISVTLTAPTKPGSYKTFFRLRNASGQYFKMDGTGDLWLKIVVGNLATATPNLTVTATVTPITPTAETTP
jgi:hypothetical protein